MPTLQRLTMHGIIFAEQAVKYMRFSTTLEVKKLREVVVKTIKHLGDNREGSQQHSMVAVIDPPRAGTAPGLITEITALQPNRVVEIFCGPDEIPRSLREFKQGGYVPNNNPSVGFISRNTRFRKYVLYLSAIHQ